MAEWKPVVGGRCVYEGNDAVVVRYLSGCAAATIECAGPWIPVAVADLREHPDDARHRRLLEAAREVGKTWAAMRNAKAPRLQADVKMAHAAAIKELRAIIAEHDAEEHHAS